MDAEESIIHIMTDDIHVPEATAKFLLSVLKEEWEKASRKPDHACSFFELAEGCHTCGIPYEEWIRLDRKSL